MINLNEYIFEKFKISKDISISSKEYLINEIYEIVAASLKNWDMHSKDYMISMIEDEINRFIVSPPNYDKCNVISINFKKDAIENLEKKRISYTFFLKNLKKDLVKNLKKLDVTVKIVENTLSSRRKKIHIVL